MKRFILVLSLLLIPSICFAEKTVTLEVYSEPSGAIIYIDGTYVGTTPYQNPDISIGKHEVRAFLNSDFLEKRETINITEVDPVTHTFYFTAGEGDRFGRIEEEQVIQNPTGNVFVASTPSGAMVYLKGQQPKKTSRCFKKIDVGRYEVEFKLNGKSLKSHFDIIKDETVMLIADFSQEIIINKWVEDQEEKARQAELACKERERQAELARIKEEKTRLAKFEKIKSVGIISININESSNNSGKENFGVAVGYDKSGSCFKFSCTKPYKEKCKVFKKWNRSGIYGEINQNTKIYAEEDKYGLHIFYWPRYINPNGPERQDNYYYFDVKGGEELLIDVTFHPDSNGNYTVSETRRRLTDNEKLSVYNNFFDSISKYYSKNYNH